MSSTPAAGREAAPGRSSRLHRLRRAFRDPQTAAGALIVTALVAVALLGPELLATDPMVQSLASRLQPPSPAHPFGTDRLGRDVFARVVHGARFSLGIAVAVTAVRLVIGVGIGLVSGYSGGWIDELLMRFVDLLFAFPGIVLALVIAGIAGPSLTNVLLALAVVGWGTYARVVRSEVLTVRERDYVTAARLSGTPRHRLVLEHILPNVLGPTIVLAMLDIGTVVLATAGLSFLGLGAQPPTPEWGTMIASGRHYLQTAWWLVNVPGLAIVLTVLGFTLLGDGLRDAFDPDGSTNRGQ